MLRLINKTLLAVLEVASTQILNLTLIIDKQRVRSFSNTTIHLCIMSKLHVSVLPDLYRTTENLIPRDLTLRVIYLIIYIYNYFYFKTVKVFRII